MKVVSRRRRPAELRELLLGAAEKIFSCKGFADSTMESIAVEAGVAPSVLYRHFPTKQDLFREVVLQPFLQFLRDYHTTWSGQRHAPWDAHKLMHAMITEFYDSIRLHRHGVLSIASIDGLIDKRTTGEIQKQLDTVFAEMLSIGEEEADLHGWYPKENLDLTIRLILGMVASAAVLDSLFLPPGRRRPTRRQLIDHLVDFALYGLRLQPL
ncbi:TetR/AcrR family transcriptional regulator [Zhongshania marina]